jgi:hypothetical protein
MNLLQRQSNGLCGRQMSWNRQCWCAYYGAIGGNDGHGMDVLLANVAS